MENTPTLPEEKPYTPPTPSQKLFVIEYLKDRNGTKAAIRAGYSPKTAYSQANALLNKREIQDEIRAQIEEQFARIKIEADTVIKAIAQLAMVDPAEAFDENNALKPINHMPKPLRMAIQAIEVDEIFEGRGNDREKIGETKRIKFISRLEALRDLGKHFKLFTDVIEHRGIDGLAEKMAAARKRRKQCQQIAQTKPQTK